MTENKAILLKLQDFGFFCVCIFFNQFLRISVVMLILQLFHNWVKVCSLFYVCYLFLSSLLFMLSILSSLLFNCCILNFCL